MSRSDWLALTALSLLWGGSFVLMKIALSGFQPITTVAGRVLIAAVVLGAIVAASGQRFPRGWTIWLSFLGMGVLNNVIPWILVAYAQTTIPSGLAAILNAATPLITALVAHAMTTDEKLTPLRLAGVLVGLIGVALIVGPSALAGLDQALLAEIVCLVATVSYALSGVYGRRFRRMDITPMVAAFGQVAAASAVMVPLALIVDRPWTQPAPGGDAIAALVTIGVVSTAFAYILFYRILAAAGATNLMLVTFLIPAWAIILGNVVFGEALSPMHVAGMLVVGLGLALIDGRLLTSRSRVSAR